MYVTIWQHQHTRAQARGATPELRRGADTTSHGLSADRHSTQTTIGSPSLCDRAGGGEKAGRWCRRGGSLHARRAAVHAAASYYLLVNRICVPARGRQAEGLMGYMYCMMGGGGLWLWGLPVPVSETDIYYIYIDIDSSSSLYMYICIYNMYIIYI